ncbi:MAG: hypothetical protein RQ866_01345 [Bacteroidales bacterium]|nr:hypothetical protein [Bacteroidales bacterium]
MHYRKLTFYSLSLGIVLLIQTNLVFGQDDKKEILHDVFANQYTYLKKYISNDHFMSLYKTQIWTNNLLYYAGERKEYAILDSLAGLYLAALEKLERPDFVIRYNGVVVDTLLTGGFYTMWRYPMERTVNNSVFQYREEHLLSSAQFLYLVSMAVNYSLEAPPGRYSNIDSLVQAYPEIILAHHYRRWIFEMEHFQVKGWGCIEGWYNHYEFLQMKNDVRFARKKRYCGALTDSDLWIIAGLCEMMDANRRDSAKVFISETDKALFRVYLEEAADILQSRIDIKRIKTASGTVAGFAFDEGYWNHYPDYRYERYEDTLFPGERRLKWRKRTSSRTAWDISHGRRFFFAFQSVIKAAEVTGVHYPDSSVLEALANQLVYVIYDKKQQAFRNFINGNNGWYRVGYHGEGTASPPWSLSLAALEGGWLFLGKYNSDVNAIHEDMIDLVFHQPQKMSNRYGVYYRNYEPEYLDFSLESNSRLRQLMLLQFLPSVML